MSASPSITESRPSAPSGLASELCLVLGALVVLAFGLGYVTGGVVARADEPQPAARAVQAVQIQSTKTIVDEPEVPASIDRFPARITEEQIAAMTPQEVSKHLTAVAKAKNKMKRDQDPELFDRLKNEFDLLMKRMREKR